MAEEAEESRRDTRQEIRETLNRAKARIGASNRRMVRSRTSLAAAEATIATLGHDRGLILSSDAELRSSVTAMTRRLRNMGLTCERVLVYIKTDVLETAPRTLGTKELRQLLEKAVRWSVEAFYDDAPAGERL